jgi:hypothetical protein
MLSLENGKSKLAACKREGEGNSVAEESGGKEGREDGRKVKEPTYLL